MTVDECEAVINAWFAERHCRIPSYFPPEHPTRRYRREMAQGYVDEGLSAAEVRARLAEVHTGLLLCRYRNALRAMDEPTPINQAVAFASAYGARWC